MWTRVIMVALLALTASNAGAQTPPFGPTYRRGLDQLHAGKVPDSIRTMQSAINALGGQDPPDPTIYINLGWAQMNANQLGEARKTFLLARQHWSQLTPAERSTLANNEVEIGRLATSRR